MMNNIQKKFLPTNEAAQRIGIPPGTLSNMAWKKTGPKFYKVGPDGHLKIPHLWPGQNPPPECRQNGVLFSCFSFLTQVF